uniref:Cytochrome P450 n=1 Tax=Parascaris univalens TaxID=6257 RepID=A0A915B4W7_PARUN
MFLRRRGYPPGPRPLPLIGNFHQIDLAYPHRTMLQWKRKYGGIFTVWLPKPIIVLAEFDAFKEALIKQGDTFAGRPMSYLYGIFTHHQPDGDGIILSQNEKWLHQRRFALRVFRDFGMGKKLMETKIDYHTDKLIEHIRRQIHRKAIDIMNIHLPIAFCVGNIIQDLVLGMNYEFGDKNFLRFKKLIDSTLADKLAQLNKKTPLSVQFHESSLRSKISLALNAGDLWTGGMETTVTTLRWAIIYLIRQPNVQERLFKEIEMKIGTRKVTWADRTTMHYTMAVINEVQRIVNILPWHIPHATTADTILRGYHIAKGTTIMPQMGAAIHYNNELFPDGEKFDPERFLSEDGTFRTYEQFNPFGFGKRSCLGEGLARVLPSLDRSPGMASVPKEYFCLVKERN